MGAAHAYGQSWHGSLDPVDRVGVLGLSYSGKTYFADKLVAGATRRVFVTPMPKDYVAPGRTVLGTRQLLSQPQLLRAPHFAIVVQLESDSEDGMAAEVIAIIRLVRKAASDDPRIRGMDWGGIVLVLDEVGDYKNGAAVIGGEKVTFMQEASRLARNGRHHNVVSVWVSQCAIDIPPTVRRQWTRVYSFVQVDKRDLDALAERGGDEFAQRVAAWQPGEPPAMWALPTLQRRH